jgi:Xaa-Pro aminopeptidase
MDELRTKERRVREYLSANGLDAVLLTLRDNFAWITCGGANHVRSDSELGVASALLTKDAKYIITTNIEAQRIADEEVADMGFDVREHPWYEAAGREKLVWEIVGDGRCASDDRTTGTVALAPDFMSLRYSLTDAEKERFGSLGVDCGQVVANVTREITIGETERSIAARLSADCLERRIAPGVVLVAADERLFSYRHPVVKDAQVHRCAMVVLCGRRHGLVCSLTRIVYFGKLSEDIRRKHEACTAIDAAMIAATQPGAKAADALKKGLALYEDYGYGAEWQRHHQGGAAGYLARDYVVTPECAHIVQPCQAFAWNPSLTGTKSEDTILATGEGPVVLSLAGEWPTVECRVDTARIERADILVKS